jgi:hypothetical protein
MQTGFRTASLILGACLLLLMSCRGWDDYWHIDDEWSFDLTFSQTPESVARVQRLCLLKARKRHMYTILEDFMDQQPVCIDDRTTIESILRKIAYRKNCECECPASDRLNDYYHLVAFDAERNSTYIRLLTCDDGVHTAVIDYLVSGIYWVAIPQEIVNWSAGKGWNTTAP